MARSLQTAEAQISYDFDYNVDDGAPAATFAVLCASACNALVEGWLNNLSIEIEKLKG